MRAYLIALCAFLLPVAAHAEDTVPTGKLPDTAAPTAYRLDLTVLPSHDRFSGHAEIDVTIKKATPMLYMRGRSLNVTKATATIAGKTFPVTLKQITPLGLDRLDFGRTVKPGKVTLKFDYDADFATGTAGLYHLKVGDQWYSWTQFESIDARAAFPSFDEPGFKTPFTVSLTTKPGFTAISNAPQTGTTKVGDLVRHKFAATKPLPTYLVAFVVGPFLTADTSAAPTQYRSDALPIRIVATQANKGKLGFAKQNTGPIVDLLEKYFGERFPFPKLDQIGSPIMPGAMENAGADIYGDGILLLDKDPTTSAKQEFGMVVAHELSHQWFGDLVTPAWWDDIWLNESFANWMGYRIGNEWRPDLNIGTNAIEEAFRAMDLDALKAGRPIHQKITRDADINSAFDAITYGKGGQVVKMIAAYMGDAEFQKGVRLHLKRHAYGNATTDQFFQSLADAAGDPRVLAAMRSFVDQQGVPVVTLHHDDGKLVATQSRYSYLGTDLAPEQWTIPLCIRRADTKKCSLLEGKPMDIALPGTGAIMPNAGGNGYYRFQLDPADWDALIKASPSLVPGEGLALDDSLWASFMAGKAGPARLIALTRAAAQNPDSNVAVDNGHRFRYLASHGIIPDNAMPAYRKLIGDTYRPLLDRLGFDPATNGQAGDTPDEQKLRREVVGLLAGAAQDDAVRTTIKTATKAYLGGDEKALAPTYLGTGLSLLVADNDLAYAKSLADKALDSEDGQFRSAALGAVAGSGKSDIAKWLLASLDDARIRRTERLALVGDIAGNADTRQLALDYMIGNFDKIAKDAGIFAALRIPGMFSGSCSIEQANALDTALRPRIKEAGVGELGFNRTLERIRACARIKSARSDEVGQALLSAE
ncbi:M1 family metallopeptidase [Stakelama marina]|uniref:Aminopeptidase n=1 Tax=Stakelama marina TaxID=2826939 RepID=A0A8T4I8C4_9SPHN|nr:M1 family metallopeptidase [Stakelama marina]MBR0551238.1 M1 family metallopeptidase [Stakelama marina]